MVTLDQFENEASPVIGPMDVVRSQGANAGSEGPRIKSVEGGKANPTNPPVLLKTDSCGMICETVPLIVTVAEFERTRVLLGKPGTGMELLVSPMIEMSNSALVKLLPPTAPVPVPVNENVTGSALLI